MGIVIPFRRRPGSASVPGETSGEPDSHETPGLLGAARSPTGVASFIDSNLRFFGIPPREHEEDSMTVGRTKPDADLRAKEDELFGRTPQPTAPDPDQEIEEDADATLEYMRKSKLPMTREVWMELSYPDGPPVTWTAELEAEVPEQFQKKDW